MGAEHVQQSPGNGGVHINEASFKIIPTHPKSYIVRGSIVSPTGETLGFVGHKRAPFPQFPWTFYLVIPEGINRLEIDSKSQSRLIQMIGEEVEAWWRDRPESRPELTLLSAPKKRQKRRGKQFAVSIAIVSGVAIVKLLRRKPKPDPPAR